MIKSYFYNRLTFNDALTLSKIKFIATSLYQIATWLLYLSIHNFSIIKASEMKKNLHNHQLFVTACFISRKKLLRKHVSNLVMCFLLLLLIQAQTFAQGTWSKIATKAPASGGGGMLLLSDGSVICKSSAGGSDGIGNTYMKLTPDVHGSYVNGTWSLLPPMFDTRLYYSSQVLKDGRVYVAGGEYGTGNTRGETYNPVTNTWTKNGAIGSGLSDANSGILDNGLVLQALVSGNLKSTKLYDPVTNTYSTGPTCVGIHNESTWVKLKDGSTLMVDRGSTNSERYIPSLNKWIADATVPVSLYDPFGLETGAGLLLPDGRAFFIGSRGQTAYYTPSGNTSPGVWSAGPSLPNAQGQPDAPAAMMVNGKILLSCSPSPTAGNHFPAPTSFYVFDYLTNSYTRVNSPAGSLTAPVAVYVTNMTDLPDGSVLFSYQDSTQYYVFTPDGTPLASGKPVIKSLKKASGASFMLTGNLFNGISEGANYGDDWQMNSNYPLVRLTSGTNVYYARSFNWNSTGVQRGTAADTCFITAPAGLPHGTYSLQVVANGIASNPLTVRYLNANLVAADVYAANATQKTLFNKATNVYPNPAKNSTTLSFYLNVAGNVGIMLYDTKGTEVANLLNADLQAGENQLTIKTNNFLPGVYLIKISTTDGVETRKLIKE